jgi:hypothetical protein
MVGVMDKIKVPSQTIKEDEKPDWATEEGE